MSPLSLSPVIPPPVGATDNVAAQSVPTATSAGVNPSPQDDDPMQDSGREQSPREGDDYDDEDINMKDISFMGLFDMCAPNHNSICGFHNTVAFLR